MLDTDSTPTGTLWPWCSGGPARDVPARHGAGQAPAPRIARRGMAWRLSLRVALAAVAAACVTTTTKYYLPSEGEDRLSTDEVRERADDLLRVECPRLLGGATAATGTARLTVDVGADGAVTRARVRTSSGDQRVDDMFGALAARLQVDAPERGPTTARITMGYSCAPNEAVTTVQLNQ